MIRSEKYTQQIGISGGFENPNHVKIPQEVIPSAAPLAESARKPSWAGLEGWLKEQARRRTAFEIL